MQPEPLPSDPIWGWIPEVVEPDWLLPVFAPYS